MYHVREVSNALAAIDYIGFTKCVITLSHFTKPRNLYIIAINLQNTGDRSQNSNNIQTSEFQA